jgi:hypothetical protein
MTNADDGDYWESMDKPKGGNGDLFQITGSCSLEPPGRELSRPSPPTNETGKGKECAGDWDCGQN